MKLGDKVMVVPVKPHDADSRPTWTPCTDEYSGTVGTVERTFEALVRVRFTDGNGYNYPPSRLIPVTETPDGWLIKKPEPKYRPARMPEDYGKPCRVRDSESEAWEYDIVCGYRRGHDFPWVAEEQSEQSFRYCEVEV